MSTVTLSLADARSLAKDVLVQHDTSEPNAECVAWALVAAEADGQKGHGLSRLPSYAAQAASGKVDGHAVPILEQGKGAALRIDARNGFAFPAMAMAVERLSALAVETGIAAAAVHHRHAARGPARIPPETREPAEDHRLRQSRSHSR